MNDAECVSFLKWCLPMLGMRWKGFKKVRRQVCSRIDRHILDRGLPGIKAYRACLERSPEAWKYLDFLCRVTISRFYRDRDVFDAVRHEVIPEVKRMAERSGEDTAFCWSACCCGGEEAYTMKILWEEHRNTHDAFSPSLRIIATDIDEEVLERARTGIYSESSLKDLPREFVDEAFERRGGMYSVGEEFKDGIEFILEDIRETRPPGRFHVILCRNCVLTYYEEDLQQKIMKKVVEKLLPGGFLIVGKGESLPKDLTDLIIDKKRSGIHRKLENSEKITVRT